MAITNTVKRITKSQRFDDIKALLMGNPVTYGTTVEDAVNFCEAEQALLAKKNASDKKPTANQIANNGYKELILAFLADQEEGVTCTEVQKGVPEFADFNNQKIAQLLRLLYEAGKISKETKKGRSMFSLA